MMSSKQCPFHYPNECPFRVRSLQTCPHSRGTSCWLWETEGTGAEAAAGVLSTGPLIATGHWELCCPVAMILANSLLDSSFLALAFFISLTLRLYTANHTPRVTMTPRNIPRRRPPDVIVVDRYRFSTPTLM